MPQSAGQDDGSSATPSLRKKTHDRAATDRAKGINDRDHRLLAHAETALFLEKGRIEILCAVRHVVERGHEQNGVHKQETVLPNEPENIERRFLLPLTMTLPDR